MLDYEELSVFEFNLKLKQMLEKEIVVDSKIKKTDNAAWKNAVNEANNKKNDEICSFIKNYIIPDNLLAYYDFFVLACSFIDVDIFESGNINNEKLSRVWFLKMEYAYNKALLFGSDEKILRMGELYRKKLEAIEKAKARVRINNICIFIVIIVLCALSGVIFWKMYNS